MPFDRVITGTVVTTDAILREGYVALRGETIAAIGQGAPPQAAETFSHGANLIMPGLVDGHMHTASSTGWPGIETASRRAAAAGGVTMCCDMPYDVPLPVTDARLSREKIGWVERTSHVDMALNGTITKTGGISAFMLSTHEYDAIRFPRIDHPTMLAAFHAIAKTGFPVAIHSDRLHLHRSRALAAGGENARRYLRPRRGLSPTLMATYCAERSAKSHGLWPKKGAIRIGSDADLVVLEPGDFVFDEAMLVDRPEMNWSPWHGQKMRARVAATWLRGRMIWDGKTVLARPGDGRSVARAGA